MTPLIMQAMAYGYQAEEVLDFLSKKIPKASKAIKRSLSMGFAPAEVLDFLGKSGKFKVPKKAEKEAAEFNSSYTQYLKNSGVLGNSVNTERVKNSIVDAAKYVPPILAAAGGIYAASRGMPAIARGAASMMGEEAAAETMGLPHFPKQISSSQRPGLPAPEVPVAEAAPTPQAPVAPAAPMNPTPNVPNAGQILDSLGVSKVVRNLADAGNEPAQIASAINFLTTPKQRKELKGLDLPALVEQFLTEGQEQETPTPVNEEQGMQPSPAVELEEQRIDQGETPKNTPFVPEKGKTVSTANGLIGEIKSFNGKEVLVQDNGKIHKVPLSEIEDTPEDVLAAVQDLLKIPEVDKSSVVSLFTYDPEDNTMYIQYHNGETYKYLDMDKDKVETLAKKLGIPVTSGKNMFGAWSPEDKKSLGAALIKEIIKDPKYAKQEEGTTWRKLDTYYDYWKKLRKPPHKKKKKI